MFQVKTVLAPVDFSPCSEHSLRYAVWLARKLDASVTAVHVVPFPVYGAAPLLPTPLPDVEFRHRAEKEMHDFVEKIRVEAQTDLAIELRTGIAHKEINDCAAKMKADLIVMGTHGRSGLERTLLGSIAEKVVRTAQIPVVTISMKP